MDDVIRVYNRSMDENGIICLKIKEWFLDGNEIKKL